MPLEENPFMKAGGWGKAKKWFDEKFKEELCKSCLANKWEVGFLHAPDSQEGFIVSSSGGEGIVTHPIGKQFLRVTCLDCGHTQFFDRSVIGV